MMKIEFLTNFSEYGFAAKAGEVKEVRTDYALQIIKAGKAKKHEEKRRTIKRRKKALDSDTAKDED